jgi:UDP-N-acetylglucosamine 3-dehydrogenase
VDEVRVAVIGTGAMGKNHIRCLKELPFVKLTAVADPSPATLNGAKGTVPVYETCEDLLATQAIDAAIVAAPTSCHFRIGKLLLEASVPTLIEKPLAASSSEALGLLELSRAKRTLLMVGHIERYNPAVVAAKRCIDGGILGDVVSISARRVGLAPPAVQNGNNVILDMAVHDLDVITWLFGRLPITVLARAGHATGHTADDYADILMSFGVSSGLIQANWLTPVRIRTLTITGTEAYAELDYVAQSLKIYRHKAFSGTASYEDLRTLAGQIQAQDIAIEREEPLKGELRNFLDALRGIAPPVATAQIGAVAVRLAELAMSSDGRPLSVDLPKLVHA